MPNKTISEFSNNTNPSGENVFPIVVNGVTMKQSLSGLTGFFNISDNYITGGTYSSGTATFTNNTGGTFDVTGFTTGGGMFTGGTVTGPTQFTDGLTANTISATTYYNLPNQTVTGFIPLSGTTSGNTVTGDIQVSKDVVLKSYDVDQNSTNRIYFGDNYLESYVTDDIYVGTVFIDKDVVKIGSTNPLSRGLLGVLDYSSNITDLDYTQKIYVDTAISNAITGSSFDTYVTGGTYSDGTAIFINNTGGTFNVSGFNTGGGTFTGGTVTGPTDFTNGLTANTISATTYLNLPSTSPITIANTNSLFSTGLVGSGSGSTATNSIFLIENAGKGATGISNSIFLGRNSGLNASNATNSVFFGSSAGNAASGASYSNFIGQGSGYKATGASYSNFFGLNAGYEGFNARNSNFIGYQAGYRASNANSSNFFGLNAGYNVTNANYSNFMGWFAGDSATNAQYSNFLGQGAGRDATNAMGSNFFGRDAGRGATNTSFSNLFGYNVGNAYVSDSIGSNNIIIGTNISLPSGATNSINFGGVLFGTGTYSDTGTTPSIIGQTSGRIGINKVVPTTTLHIYSETADTSGLRLERLTSSASTSAGQAIGVDISGNVVTISGETAVSIKTKYESNANTNAYTDSDKNLVTSSVQPSINTVFSSVNSNVIVSLTSATNTISWTGLESNLLKIILVQDSILANPSTPVNNAIYQFIVEQDGTGLWTLSYGNMFKFQNGIAPVIDINPNSKGILTALYDGTDLLVVSVQNFL